MRKNPFKLLYLSFVIILMNSCTHYYYAYKVFPNSEEVYLVDSLQKAGKFVILRTGNDAYNMTSVKIDSSTKTLTTKLEPVSEEHKLHIMQGNRRHLSYSKSDNSTKTVTDEVHVYVKPGKVTGTGTYSIADTSIVKLEILNDDKIKTRKTHNMSVVGGIVSGFLLVGLIIIFVQLSKLA